MRSFYDSIFFNVPHLRFPEFSGEWKKVRLGEKCNMLCGYAFNGEDIVEQGSYLLMRGINITEGSIRHSSELDRYYSGSIEKLDKYKLAVGDLVIGMDGSKVGRNSAIVSSYEDGSYLVQRVCRIKSSIGNNYILQFINNTKFHQYVDTVKTSSAIPHISLGDIQNFRISIPPTQDETDKIAKLFLLLDERIATQNKIIEKLESLIRGIVTKICSGAFVKGKYVFLRDILIERHIKNTENYEVYSVSVSQGIINQIDYLGRSFAAKETLHYNVVNYGDIVYTKSPTGDFPYGIVKRSHILKPVAVSPLYGVYQPKNDYIGKYLHLYFKSPINTKNYLHRLIQKGAKNTINITNSHFLDNNVFIPEKPELINIVNLTSAIEDKLVLASRMLDSLKSQKGYLLSKMFI